MIGYVSRFLAASIHPLHHFLESKMPTPSDSNLSPSLRRDERRKRRQATFIN
jgi:hypothetical protein